MDKSDPKTANKKVAIKKSSVNPKKFEAAKKELMHLKTIGEKNHPNLVKLIDFDMDKDSIYLILEFCDEGSLASKIKKQNLSEKQALQILLQIASGLKALHTDHKITHRDLKPDNILINKGVAKIADFGIAVDKPLHQTLIGT